MKQRIAYIELQPSDGMWLTQAELSNNEQRIFSDRVFCPSEEDTTKWTEWTNEQKAQWEIDHPIEEPSAPPTEADVAEQSAEQ